MKDWIEGLRHWWRWLVGESALPNKRSGLMLAGTVVVVLLLVFGLLGGWLLAVGRPCGHQRAPFFQGRAAPVSSLDRIADLVRERGLCDLAREGGRVAAPIAKRRSEAVRC